MNPLDKLALSVRPGERKALLKEATSEFLRQAKAQHLAEAVGGKISRSERKKISRYNHMRWLANNTPMPTVPKAARVAADQSVYVIGCAGHPIKIGVATDPTRRLSEIQTGFPHRLRIYWTSDLLENAREIERQAHAKLSDYRLNGEWFDVDPRDAVEIIKGLLP